MRRRIIASVLLAVSCRGATAPVEPVSNRGSDAVRADTRTGGRITVHEKAASTRDSKDFDVKGAPAPRLTEEVARFWRDRYAARQRPAPQIVTYDSLTQEVSDVIPKTPLRSKEARAASPDQLVLDVRDNTGKVVVVSYSSWEYYCVGITWAAGGTRVDLEWIGRTQ